MESSHVGLGFTPRPLGHQEVAGKLRRLRQLAEGLPGSGWVQPQDVRVLLRPGNFGAQEIQEIQEIQGGGTRCFKNSNNLGSW